MPASTRVPTKGTSLLTVALVFPGNIDTSRGEAIMTGSGKSYTAPSLEALDMRSTHDIDVHVGLPGPDINVTIDILGS